MDKIYVKVKFPLGSNVEDAVNLLLSYKAKGRLAWGEFNKHELYSDTVTSDNAHMDIVGRTKSQLEKTRQEFIEKYNADKLEHEKQLPDLIKLWVEKGQKIISHKKWVLWEEIVPIRLKDIYRGNELKACLDIIEKLEYNRPMSEIDELLNEQNHSGTSFWLVCHLVQEFSDKGTIFMQYINKKY